MYKYNKFEKLTVPFLKQKKLNLHKIYYHEYKYIVYNSK